MKLKDYLIASVAVVATYGMIVLPGHLIKAADLSDEIDIRDLRTPASIELETSEGSESVDSIPEVTVSWNELKTLVEAPEGSGEVLTEVNETVTENVSKNTVVYFDVPMSEELQSYIFKLCENIGIKPEIVIAMIDRESKFDSDIIGDNGRAFGLMQIHPRWHSERMEELGCTDLLNPFDNVTVGIDILGELLETGGSIEWVLMAYNGGEGYADSLVAEGRVSDYVKDVLGGAESVETRE